jgi:hypothetical protein
LNTPNRFDPAWNREKERYYLASATTAKLNRGTFAAMFFLATMKAIGRETVSLEEI